MRQSIIERASLDKIVAAMLLTYHEKLAEVVGGNIRAQFKPTVECRMFIEI